MKRLEIDSENVVRLRRSIEMSSVFVDPAMTELNARMRRPERAGAAVRLLYADHLIAQHGRGERLVRRQDLPEEAFYDGPIGANSGVDFLAIS